MACSLARRACHELVQALATASGVRAPRVEDLDLETVEAPPEDQSRPWLGAARMRAYGTLGIDITRNAAPWAPISNPTAQTFIGPRVDPRSFVWQPIYEVPPLNVLAQKS